MNDSIKKNFARALGEVCANIEFNGIDINSVVSEYTMSDTYQPQQVAHYIDVIRNSLTAGNNDELSILIRNVDICVSQLTNCTRRINSLEDFKGFLNELCLTWGNANRIQSQVNNAFQNAAQLHDQLLAVTRERDAFVNETENLRKQITQLKEQIARLQQQQMTPPQQSAPIPTPVANP